MTMVSLGWLPSSVLKLDVAEDEFGPGDVNVTLDSEMAGTRDRRQKQRPPHHGGMVESGKDR